jgi:hypothetical protein
MMIQQNPRKMEADPAKPHHHNKKESMVLQDLTYAFFEPILFLARA